MKKYILSALVGAAAAFGLQAQDYKVVVTTTDGEKHTYETTDVSKITFSDAPDYIPAEYCYQAVYRTQDSQGIYKMRLADCPVDEYDEPGEVGGFELDLTVCAAMSADRLNAELPAGYYRIGNGSAPMTWDITKSGLYLRLAEGEDGVSPHMLADGTIDVRRAGNEYDIRAELQLLTGEKMNFRYTGPLSFKLSDLENDAFTESIDIVLDGCQGRYYANWFYPFCDDMTLQLFNGEWSADGAVQIEGYWVNLPIYMPKSADPMGNGMRLADGVYKMESRNLNSYYNVPFTYQYGRMMDLWGTISPADAYVIYVDRQGANKCALLREGTVTVSGEGTKIVFDMDTDTPGVRFKATYTGKPNLRSFCDNSNAMLATSTLEGNYDLNLSNNQTAFAFRNSEYIVDGLSWFEIYVTDPEYANGDYLQIHLLAEGDELPDGVYNINNALTNMTGLRGAVTPGGEIALSWMSDLSTTDSEGVQSVLAPIAGGYVTVYTLDENRRRLVFDLEDEKGNLISGTYKGYFGNFNDENAAPRRVVKRR